MLYTKSYSPAYIINLRMRLFRVSMFSVLRAPQKIPHRGAVVEMQQDEGLIQS